MVSNFGVQEKENLFGSVFFVSQQPNGGGWKLLFSWILLFVFFFPTSFFKERVQEDMKEHVKPFINYCCFKYEGRHILGPWILGKINPTNCCVKYLPGLLLLWGLQTKKIYSIIFFYLFFVSQQPNGHRRRVDFNAWKSRWQSTKGRWPWAQKQHSQSSCPGAPPPGLPPAPPSIHPPYPIIRMSKPIPTPYTRESHHHIILLFHFLWPCF